MSIFSLTSSRKANIVWCEHEDFKIHQVSEPLLIDGVNSLEDDDRSSLDGHCLAGALMGREVVCGNLCVVAFNELFDLLEGEVKVESVWMVKVVVRSVIMLVRPTDKYSSLEMKSYRVGRVLTRDLCKNCRGTSWKCFRA